MPSISCFDLHTTIEMVIRLYHSRWFQALVEGSNCQTWWDCSTTDQTPLDWLDLSWCSALPFCCRWTRCCTATPSRQTAQCSMKPQNLATSHGEVGNSLEVIILTLSMIIPRRSTDCCTVPSVCWSPWLSPHTHDQDASPGCSQSIKIGSEF